MAGPRLRLALFALAVAAGLLAFSVLDVLDTRDVQQVVDGAGAFAPVVYVPLSAVLGCLLVPGPVLAGVSGALFGTATGTVVTLSASTLGAVLGLWIARWAGRDAVADLGHARVEAVSRALERHGLGAVVAQRLAPGVPDAPLTYAFGVLGLQTWQIALGTLVGSAPRAFSYTAIGASLDDPTGAGAIAGAVVLILVTVVGAEVARRLFVGVRAAQRGR
ncbi:TVP38/TMEM64 family protein [Conexibacter sp. SYSU D00693]|uniref:TVP38/TMEM64 family protein n=1 Tax=Conexibacter sp. SYSU D00693 TaxID=2812560 RepID=UPI00196AF9EB|nr:TVP38/TMEM64 family protein [Conexibacter sp. SYSU D00693]